MFPRIQAIQEQMMQIKAEPVPFQDVSDEIFDMVRPKDPMRITLQDLISSYESTMHYLLIFVITHGKFIIDYL